MERWVWQRGKACLLPTREHRKSIDGQGRRRFPLGLLISAVWESTEPPNWFKGKTEQSVYSIFLGVISS